MMQPLDYLLQYAIMREIFSLVFVCDFTEKKSQTKKIYDEKKVLKEKPL